MAQKPKLTLFVDIVSPFGYYAFHTLQKSPIFNQVEITYIPIFLGGVMKACDNRPPINIKSDRNPSLPNSFPNPPPCTLSPYPLLAKVYVTDNEVVCADKSTYIETSRKRWAKRYSIPLSSTMPKNFPPFTLHVMRALAVVEDKHASMLENSIAALYKGMWVDNKSIHEPAVFGAILSEVLGEEKARRVVEDSTKPEAKAKLQKNTDMAFEEGAFGLPWFVATNAQGEVDRFWGFDHMGLMVEHLGLDGGDLKELRAML
ncbi:putative 2-hydroxychromene-2-carboxylate isomerase [Aureobasidium pullulans]|uniref:Putative 2-hydroxychromene-2-carboxylate isomerase n=2 Tax=Aureobasidium pullulans TaxID=5580 RepID=A0A4S9BGV4_AURPU|nr:putative 2-hydroxychromene-2-carboxylate isomerase [Aureobasidium pullulans]THX39670.1 putative 2-hydroxychromene-2-carboxylate isomerase [Aureobasidium pullulans]THZ17718.1 putative 2-hydroxychromene-2-carboxylate isomerase [Aureobasidium pullulans]